MNTVRTFVFRVDYQNEYEFIKEEIQAGRLRQGWGPIPLTTDLAATEYDPQAFVDGIVAHWSDTSEQGARDRFGILYPMLEMKPGDLIVIPKYPEPYGRSFAIAQVTGTYRFDPTSYKDYGHVIPIDPNTMRVFGHDDSFHAKRVSGKLTGYRKAINNVWNDAFIESVQALWGGTPPDDTAPSAPTQWLDDAQDRTLTNVKTMLADLPFHAIEDLVTRAFEHAGYRVQQRHHYDSEGGDADIIFSVHLPLLSELQGVDLKLFTQVKKRVGEDLNDGDGLEQLERIAADEPMALKVLFSTTSSFSDKAIETAQDKGIMLIGGDTAAAFLARGLLTSPSA